MALITDAESHRMLEKAGELRSQALSQLTGYSGTLAERQAMAGSVFRQYSCELLEDLLRVSPTGDNGDASAWVRRRHDEQLLEFGRELRDVFPEGEARHSVAQVIQRELLEAERRLKSALKLPVPPSRPASQ
jgi:hypothetical protein